MPAYISHIGALVSLSDIDIGVRRNMTCHVRGFIISIKVRIFSDITFKVDKDY